MRTRLALIMIAASMLLVNAAPVAGQLTLGADHTGVTALGASPGNPVVNPGTHTLYVPLQCRNPNTNRTCSATAQHVLAVIDSAKCRPHNPSGCKVLAHAPAGTSPLATVVDERTDTVYVADGVGAVTVVDGARCNATVRNGCTSALARIKTGGFLVALALDPATHTLYAANPNGSVFVIDVARCSAVTSSGCRRHVKQVKDPLGPDSVALDVATDTIYAANTGSGNGNTVSLIDGGSCNARDASGCGRMPHTVTVGQNPYWDVVDQATDTVYVANHDDGTVSVIDGARCNAHLRAGCRRAFPAVPTGANVAFLAVDDALHTVFALNQRDDTLSEIDTRRCGGKVTSGCRRRPRNEQATFNAPVGDNPSAFALLPHTDTAYLVNVGGEPFLGAVSVRHCNAQDTSRCRVEAPAVPDHEFLMSVDRASDTIYAGNLNRPRIDVLNGATCNVKHVRGCAPVAEIPMGHPQANLGAIDETTHTLYAPDTLSDTISVINTATCNATHTTGCHHAAPTITVGQGPGPPVLDKATHTLYVPDGSQANLVTVVDTSTCNATNTSGCGQTPASVTVGKGTYVIALDAATHTVYAAVSGFGFGPPGDTVAVIDGTRCNASDHDGCDHVAATVKVGLGPVGVDFDQLTHTVYVANNGNGDLPGTVSLINAATCNGGGTTGCGDRHPTVPVGHSPTALTADPTSGTVYVADEEDAAVSVLNGAKCRAGHTGGCATAVREQPVGSTPEGIAINPVTRSVYVSTVLRPGALSIFKTGP